MGKKRSSLRCFVLIGRETKLFFQVSRSNTLARARLLTVAKEHGAMVKKRRGREERKKVDRTLCCVALNGRQNEAAQQHRKMCNSSLSHCSLMCNTARASNGACLSLKWVAHGSISLSCWAEGRHDFFSLRFSRTTPYIVIVWIFVRLNARHSLDISYFFSLSQAPSESPGPVDD